MDAISDITCGHDLSISVQRIIIVIRMPLTTTFLFAALAAGAVVRPVLQVPLGLDSFLPAPEKNPLTRETIEMGRKLFFDKRLSSDGTVSCATCHVPAHGFTDARPLAIGVAGRKGSRRVPALVNRAYGKSFFWDGRATTLEEQVLQPIVNPREMNLTLEQALERLGTGREALAQSLAAYVRTILAGNSPYDRYVAGDRSALSLVEVEGLRIFRGKGNCASCHVGPNLTDERFHGTGIAWRDNRFTDDGRFTATGQERDRGAFKTPTLREAGRRAPYMHDGSLATLEDVIDYYDRGGTRHASLDPEIQPLRLSEAEKRALAAFLRSLTGELREGL